MPELSSYKAPSYSTFKRWAEMLGYYKLYHPREKQGGWMLIIDASIQMGDQKCVVILGCTRDKMPIGRALQLQDLEPLAVEIVRGLKGEHINTLLEKTREKIGEIESICSDRGSDILYGVKRFRANHPEIKHFVDTAHRMANFLKHYLEKDERWKSFKKAITQARREMQNSTVVGATPPNLREKARFMNVDTLVKWADGIMYLLDFPEEIPPDQAKKLESYLGWLRDYREDIEQWMTLVTLTSKARQLIREQGVHQDTPNQFQEAFSGTALTFEGLQFSDLILDFFIEQSTQLKPGVPYIGSSEVLESLFGKLKAMEREQTSFGFTSLVLAAAAQVGPLDQDTVGKAIESVRVVDIKEWSDKQVGKSVQSSRKEFYQTIRGLKKKVVTKHTGITERDAAGF